MTQGQRYPLAWPVGWKRTRGVDRREAAFGRRLPGQYKTRLSVWDATARLTQELDRLRVADPIVSTNLLLRAGGVPKSDQREPDDPGAAVYFTLHGRSQVLACDKWRRVADNLAALAAHIAAIRAVARYGVGTIEQAFGGYTALPPKTTEWWTILGVLPDATLEAIEAAFLALARQQHPDQRGGSHDGMARLTEARQAAREARR